MIGTRWLCEQTSFPWKHRKHGTNGRGRKNNRQSCTIFFLISNPGRPLSTPVQMLTGVGPNIFQSLTFGMIPSMILTRNIFCVQLCFISFWTDFTVVIYIIAFQRSFDRILCGHLRSSSQYLTLDLLNSSRWNFCLVSCLKYYVSLVPKKLYFVINMKYKY